MAQTSTLSYPSGSPVASQTITTRLEYNNRNALATIFQTEYSGSYHDRADLKYNGKGQVTEVVHEHYRYTNEYDGQGKLARQTRFAKRMGDNREEQLGYYTLKYNSQQELAEAQYFSMASGQPKAELMWRYTYTNGDPVLLEQLVPGADSYYHVQLAYDANPLPVASLAHTYFEPLRPPSVHNLISYTVQESNSSFASYTTSYTYNTAGFPETSLTRYSNGTSLAVTYTYKCQ